MQAYAAAGEDAKLLAGGQSLLPILRLRLAYPELVIDLGGIGELTGVTDDGDALLIGAMTTHADILADPLIRQHAPLIAQATETVADRQVRHRGTFGGSLAHADPAGDLPAVALALDAELRVQGPDGERSIAARDFFSDYLTTSMRPGEILTAIRVPEAGSRLVDALREAEPGRPGLVDRGGGGGGAPVRRHHHRGPDRPDQHGADPAAGHGRRAGAGRGAGHRGVDRAGQRLGRRGHLGAQ